MDRKMFHFLTVHDIDKKRKCIGKDVMIELDGSYDLCVMDGKTLRFEKEEQNVLLRLEITTNLEWSWFEHLDMKRVKQLMVKFYFPFDPMVGISHRVGVLETIRQTHWLVHLDLDNYYGSTTYYGVVYPNVFHCTYIRKDQASFLPIAMCPPRIDCKCEPFWNRPSFMATILGSCRQQPLSAHMRLSSIQEELNYPHYSKEILQQIQYLKEGRIHGDDTKYIFRKGLLSHCKDIVDPSLYDKLHYEFINTDIFVIEIASRIFYKWDGYYLHHIAQDPQYGFPYHNQLQIGDLADMDIENDLHEIRKALYPKKFIIVSHFASYHHGKRYDLIRLLERLCHQMDISFWNQSGLVAKYGKDIIHDDCHYTREGSCYAGRELYQHVQKTIFSHQRTMFHVYYTDKERVSKHTFHGLGDFLRGSIYLFQLCRRNNIRLKINFSNHHLGNVLVCDNHLSITECQDAQYFFASENTHVDMDCQHVFTNKFPMEPIDKECRLFIQGCLRPRMSLETKVRAFMRENGLMEKEYIVLHARLLDNEVYDPERLKCLQKLVQTIHEKSPEQKILFMASSQHYHDHLDAPFLIKTNLQCGHLGLPTTTPQQTEDTMIEFFLMTKCNKIYQTSVYSWGSGFSEIVHQIYQVPLEKLFKI